MTDHQTPPTGRDNSAELPDTEVDSTLPSLRREAEPESASADSTSPRQPTADTLPMSAPSPAHADWLIGQAVAGRYIIEEKIGEGSFGAVYRARDGQHNMYARRMVIKFLKEKGLDNEWVVGKFKHEVEALARLANHPGVVGLLDAGEFHKLPYIVLEYVEGVSLRKRIRPGGMELEEIAEIVRQTASALAEAHSREILHRDLKPENIMLRSLGSGETNVAVIDFGVAKVQNSQIPLSSTTGLIAGTYPYMSPEQLNGLNKSLTPAAEVYSLGVIAYELLTGVRPFNARDLASLRRLQEEGVKAMPKDLRPDLPDAAQKVLLRSLAFDPTARYQNIKTFGDEFARTLLKPDTLPDPDPPIKKKRPALLVPALGLALIITMGFAVWWLSRNNKQPTETPASYPTAAPSATAPALATANEALTYSLTVQKVFDGRPMGGPEEYSGAEMFGNGWKFKFNVTPTEDGHLYLLNAAPQPSGGTEWNVLFPTPQNNAGQSKIDGGQKQTFGWYVFDDKPGQERLWIVWSREPVSELEAAVKAATQTALVIKESRQATTVTEFLRPWENGAPAVTIDEQQKRTVIRSGQATWAYLLKLRHDKY
jgi:serine/threonine protein kinase